MEIRHHLNKYILAYVLYTYYYILVLYILGLLY